VTAIDDAAETLAKALRPTTPPHAHGWGALTGPCRTALLELVAAGWTPPSAEGGSEQERLRAEIGQLTARLDDLGRHLTRLTVEEQAFGAFRGLLVQVAHPAGRNVLRLEDGRAYSKQEVQAWVVRLLDAADKRAETARTAAAENRARREAERERTQVALFEPASRSVSVERVPVGVAEAAGL